MSSKKKEDVESNESDNDELAEAGNDKNKEESTDISTNLTKEEDKKFYEEKGIDLSHDVPIHPISIPPFEKSMVDQIVSKF
jgi:NADH-quinone oxidoreductase subunit C